MTKGAALLLSAALAAVPAQAIAQECVDTELVLLSDLSSSMDDLERRIVRDGHANAFRDGAVLDKITEGPCGAILVMYAEWAITQNIVIDWTVISSDEDAEAFAQALEAAPFSDVGTSTYLSRAMDFAAQQILSNGIEANSRVVDILGDGVDDAGRNAPAEVVNRYSGPQIPVWERITFNAIPVGENPGSVKAMTSYFRELVIGGPWARVVPATSFEDVPRAIIEKLSKELG